MRAPCILPQMFLLHNRQGLLSHHFLLVHRITGRSHIFISQSWEQSPQVTLKGLHWQQTDTNSWHLSCARGQRNVPDIKIVPKWHIYHNRYLGSILSPKHAKDKTCALYSLQTFLLSHPSWESLSQKCEKSVVNIQRFITKGVKAESQMDILSLTKWKTKWSPPWVGVEKNIQNVSYRYCYQMNNDCI